VIRNVNEALRSCQIPLFSGDRNTVISW